MKYYESLIIGRMSRLKMEKESVDTYQNKITKLIDEFGDYNTKYERAKKKSANLKEQLDQKLEELKKQIAEMYTQSENLSVEQKRVEEKIGLSGNALMECLIHIHKYSKEIKDGSNAFAPLVSILEGKFTYLLIDR